MHVRLAPKGQWVQRLNPIKTQNPNPNIQDLKVNTQIQTQNPIPSTSKRLTDIWRCGLVQDSVVNVRVRAARALGEAGKLPGNCEGGGIRKGGSVSGQRFFVTFGYIDYIGHIGCVKFVISRMRCAKTIKQIRDGDTQFRFSKYFLTARQCIQVF